MTPWTLKRILTTLAVTGLATALAGCAAIMPETGAQNVAPASTITAAEPAPPDSTNAAPVVTWQDFSIQQAAPAANLWAHVRRGFSLPDGNERRVQAELAWYRKHPGYMRRTAERAKPYLYYIVKQVNKRHMPTDLALLPIVESAYDPFGYSNASAAGLWQFVSDTGRLFGIKQNWWYDGRRDVAASTRAALDYLQLLHKRFHGDWLLALAAYNCGPNTVKRAIEHNRRRHRPTDYWHLDLPIATRAYVPRLLAIRDLIQNPGKYGIDLPFIANAPYLARIKLKGQIDLAVAANMAGISLKRIYLLNPGYNRWATPPGRHSHLFIPLNDKSRFLAKLAQMKQQVEVQWVTHRVRPGENLGTLAHRYHTTVAQLRRRNGIHGSIIRAGTPLRVPSARVHYTRYVLSQSMRLARTQNRKHGGSKVRVRVQRGDTLWGLARMYHVGATEIADWNGMAPTDALHVGQKLVIWRQPGTVTRRRTHSHRYPVSPVRRISYVVHRGDSLSSISDHFNVSLRKLAVWNSLSLSTILHPGQHLTVYVDVRNQS